MDEIRQATLQDLPMVMKLLAMGRARMRAEGNQMQWPEGEPSKEKIRRDMQAHRSFLRLVEGEAVGTFCLLETPDPNYAKIDGRWQNDAPYFTLHRVAGDPAAPGLARAMFRFAEGRARESGVYNLRIDTHRDNVGMQRVLRKAGFVYCGVIRLENGDPREAFQKIMNE